jgi:hypothetical protein
MSRKVLLTALLVSLLGGAAAAQTRVVERPSSGRQEGIVRVALSVQMFVVGPTDESDEANLHRERARKTLYDMAAKECDMLRSSIALDCRLESVNVNLNRQSNGQVNGYMVNGQMAYQITLK